MNSKYMEDFNKVLNIYINDYSHEDLINFLKTGSIAEKQAAALKLDGITSIYDAQILMSHLTGCDGKIREAVSFRLKEFISLNPEYFLNYTDIFLDAIIDINGNICRNTIIALLTLKQYEDFCKDFCRKLCDNTIKIIPAIETFDIQEGKYKINKEVFKLYWYLETIYNFLDSIDKNTIEYIINHTKNIKDYTIREKTAKILSKYSNEFINIKQELKEDENYYVRRF